MKNPLTKIYLNNIERNFKKDSDPKDPYQWEDFKADFLKNTGHDFDQLKNGSLIKAQYLCEKNKLKLQNNIERNYQMFFNDRAEYFDEDGNLLEEKWQNKVEAVNREIEEKDSIDYISSFKNEFNNTKYPIKGEIDNELTALFSELSTYQSPITVYRDERRKKINILITDYTYDYYNGDDFLIRGRADVITINEKYWPRDKYSELEKVINYYSKNKLAEGKLYVNEIENFPFAMGIEKWVKYYFERLNTNQLDKYKEYDFCINFIIFSPITACCDGLMFDHFVNGKINWN